MRKWLVVPFVVVLCLAIVGSASAQPLTRASSDARSAAKALQNNNVPKKGAPEIPLRPYSEYTYYSELAGVLASIAKQAPDRVKVIRQVNSANGNPLYLVVITQKMTRQQTQINNNYRKMLLSDPGYVLSHHWLKDGSAFARRLHQRQHPRRRDHGMDASLQVIKRLAFGTTPHEEGPRRIWWSSSIRARTPTAGSPTLARTATGST